MWAINQNNQEAQVATFLPWLSQPESQMCLASILNWVIVSKHCALFPKYPRRYFPSNKKLVKKGKPIRIHINGYILFYHIGPWAGNEGYCGIGRWISCKASPGILISWENPFINNLVFLPRILISSPPGGPDPPNYVCFINWISKISCLGPPNVDRWNWKRTCWVMRICGIMGSEDWFQKAYRKRTESVLCYPKWCVLGRFCWAVNCLSAISKGKGA